MKRVQAVSGYQIARQSMALTLSILLIPFASGTLNAQGGYAPLDAPGLDQLVAPIALYPDSLVAQVLTASTYPQQVNDADAWSQQNAGLPPQQRADIANGMPWDPSVKASQPSLPCWITWRAITAGRPRSATLTTISRAI